MNNIFLYAITVCIWGTTWIAIKLQLGSVAPEVSVFYRFFLAASILLVYCAIKRIRLRFTRKEYFSLFGLGLFLFSTNYLFFYCATAYIVSGLASVIFSMASVFIIINKAIFLRVKPKPQIAIGALLGVVGVITVFWHEVIGVNADPGILKGVVLALLGTYCFSIGNIISSRIQKPGSQIVASTTVAMVFGSLIMLAYILLNNLPFTLPNEPAYLGSLLYLAIPGSVIAFLCYLQLVGSIGPEKAGYATVLFPVIALGFSAQFEGYQWNTPDAFGFLLVLVGNYFVLSKNLSSRIFRFKTAPLQPK